MNRTSPDSERPPASEPVWERPWSVEEIRRSSQNWSLAADAGVSGGPGAKGGTELWLPLLGDSLPPVFKGAISDPGRAALWASTKHSAAQTRLSFRAEAFQPCPPRHPAVQNCFCPLQGLLCLYGGSSVLELGLNGAALIFE